MHILFKPMYYNIFDAKNKNKKIVVFIDKMRIVFLKKSIFVHYLLSLLLFLLLINLFSEC